MKIKNPQPLWLVFSLLLWQGLFHLFLTDSHSRTPRLPYVTYTMSLNVTIVNTQTFRKIVAKKMRITRWKISKSFEILNGKPSKLEWKSVSSPQSQLVLESPVSRLEKDRNWTGLDW